MPVLRAEGGQREMKYTGLQGAADRIQADRHSITQYNDSSSVLTAEEQKAGWMRLSDALLLQSESSSLTDTDGGTDRVCAAERNSIVDFGLTETHC